MTIPSTFPLRPFQGPVTIEDGQGLNAVPGSAAVSSVPAASDVSTAPCSDGALPDTETVLHSAGSGPHHSAMVPDDQPLSQASTWPLREAVRRH